MLRKSLGFLFSRSSKNKKDLYGKLALYPQKYLESPEVHRKTKSKKLTTNWPRNTTPTRTQKQGPRTDSPKSTSTLNPMQCLRNPVRRVQKANVRPDGIDGRQPIRWLRKLRLFQRIQRRVPRTTRRDGRLRVHLRRHVRL